jgi:hypothetical protein
MDKTKAKELNYVAKKLVAFHDKVIPFERWGKAYVDSETPIPLRFREEFYNELTHPDLGYRRSLEESVRWFGVRYV